MLITHRLTIKFTFLVAFILATLSISFLYFYLTFRNEEYTNQLEQTLRLVDKLLIKKDTIDNELLQIIDKTSLNKLFQEKITIFNEKNQIIYTTNPLIPNGVTDSLLQLIRQKEKISFHMEEREAVGMVHKGKLQSYVVAISAKDIHGLNEFKNLLYALLISNSIGLLIVIVAGWFFARRALEPITAIVQQVQKISPSQLAYRLDEGNRKDEIANLAMTFNKMLDKIHYSYEMKKNFVANASHELRTPLTNMLGTLETSYLYDNEVDKYKTSIASAIEEIKELIALTNELLKLTKLDNENEMPMPPKPVRLDEIVLQSIGEVKQKYPDQTLTLDFNMPEDSEAMLVMGTPHLFKIAILNVLDNACKYSHDKPVKVSLWSENQGTIKFKVVDEGIGISEDEVRLIINPMYRGSNAKGVLGFGVGLALTKTILEKYHAQFFIDSKINQGTKVTVIFPQIKK
jgi:signal transduction histidine kinase